MYSLRKDAFFTDFFLSLFLWLGIWFKFSFQMVFYISVDPEKDMPGVIKNYAGNFDFSPTSYDNVLIISFFSAFSLILTSFFIKKFFFNYKKNFLKTSKLNKVIDLNKEKIIFISLIFLFSFLIFYSINLYFSIYQKGIVYEGNIPSIFYNLFIWTIKIGFPAFASIIIYFALNLKSKQYKVKSFLLAVLESTFSSISQISRAMIFNPFSMIFGIYKYNQFEKKKFSTNNFYKSYIVLIFFFIFSLFITSELRSKFYNVKLISSKSKSENKVELKLLSHFSNFMYLAGNRWVGIEGIMSTYSLKNKSFKFLKDSFKEKYNYTMTYYTVKVRKYEQHNKFDKIKNYFSKNELKHIAIFTPGIIGFLYYSGSLIFVVFALSIILMICVLIEISVFKLTKNNYIFTSFVSNVLAYQLAHYGYMPQNTYKIIFGIFLGLIMIMIINKIIYKR